MSTKKFFMVMGTSSLISFLVGLGFLFFSHRQKDESSTDHSEQFIFERFEEGSVFKVSKDAVESEFWGVGLKLVEPWTFAEPNGGTSLPEIPLLSMAQDFFPVIRLSHATAVHYAALDWQIAYDVTPNDLLNRTGLFESADWQVLDAASQFDGREVTFLQRKEKSNGELFWQDVWLVSVRNSTMIWMLTQADAKSLIDAQGLFSKAITFQN